MLRTLLSLLALTLASIVWPAASKAQAPGIGGIGIARPAISAIGPTGAGAVLPDAQINLAIPPGFADLRKYGAVCDGVFSGVYGGSGVNAITVTGTDSTASVAAAQAAGFSNLYLPAGCIITETTIPAGITIIGQAPLTSSRVPSVIKSPDRTVNTGVGLGAHSAIQNVSIIDYQCDNSVFDPATGVPPYTITPAGSKICPIVNVANGSDVTKATFVPWPQSTSVFYANTTFSMPGNAVDCNATLTSAPGCLHSNLNAYAAVGSYPYAALFYAQASATNGFGFQAASAGDSSIGFDMANGLFGTLANTHTGFKCREFGTGGQTGPGGECFYGTRVSVGGGSPTMMRLDDVDMGVGDTSTTDFIDIITNHQTSGYLQRFFQSTSIFTGDVLHADMAQSAGTFSGNFLTLNNASLTKFNVASSGATTINQNAVSLPSAANTQLQIGAADAVAPHVYIDAFGAAPIYVLRQAGGTNASKSALVGGTAIGTIGISGYNGSAYSPVFSLVQFNALGSWTTGSEGASVVINAVPSGATATELEAVFVNGVQIGSPAGSTKGVGTLNVAGAYYANNTIGVTCSGSPTASFASTNGIVTHC